MATEDRILSMMRQMAWERAKGELNSMLTTYYDTEKYEGMKKAIEEFITIVEDHSLQE